MSEDEVEYLLRSLLAGHEQDINDYAAQLEKDYEVPDEVIDEIASREGKLTPNDIMTLLRLAGRDFEYAHDPEPDDEKYMGYIRDALKCNRIQRMMKELQHD